MTEKGDSVAQAVPVQLGGAVPNSLQAPNINGGINDTENADSLNVVPPIHSTNTQQQDEQNDQLKAGSPENLPIQNGIDGVYN